MLMDIRKIAFLFFLILVALGGLAIVKDLLQVGVSKAFAQQGEVKGVPASQMEQPEASSATPVEQTNPPSENQFNSIGAEDNLAPESDASMENSKYSWHEIVRDPFEPPSELGVKNDKAVVTQESDLDQVTSESFADTDLVSSSPSGPFGSALLREYQLLGIVWNVKSPKALFKDPSGQLVKVQIGYKLGREGAVTWKIREKEVVFLIPYKGDYKNARIYIHRIKN